MQAVSRVQAAAGNPQHLIVTTGKVPASLPCTPNTTSHFYCSQRTRSRSSAVCGITTAVCGSAGR